MLETAKKYTVDIDSEGNASSASQETNTITGGYINRVSCAMPKTCHSICVTVRAVEHPSAAARMRDCFSFCFPHSSLSPPFHHATACPTMTGRLLWSVRRSSDRKRAQTSSRVEERLDCREQTQCGFGVLHGIGESPQKIGWWGAKREEERSHSRYQPLDDHS